MRFLSNVYRYFILVCAISLFVISNSNAQKKYPHPKLQMALEELSRSVNGDVGIYVKHLKTGQEWAINADTLFPSASIVKVPILIGVFDMIARGELAYDSVMTYDPTKVKYPYEDDGIVASLKDSAQIALNKLMMLMITTSDNTASIWLQDIVTGQRINRLMEEQGYAHVRVNSRTPGRESIRERYGWGQLTPREITQLMMDVYHGKVISREVSDEIYRILTRIYYDGEALAFIPPWVQAASKQGAVNQSRSEVVLVNAPSGEYAFCVVTKKQQDASWEYENQGYVLIRNVSKLLWQTFEPRHPWQQPTYDTKKWW